MGKAALRYTNPETLGWQTIDKARLHTGPTPPLPPLELGVPSASSTTLCASSRKSRPADRLQNEKHEVDQVCVPWRTVPATRLIGTHT